MTYDERLKDYLDRQYKLPFITPNDNREFIFNSRKICTGSHCVKTIPQVILGNDLIGKRIKYVPANKYGTAVYENGAYVIKWDDSKLDSVIDTEYGDELTKQCEIICDEDVDNYRICSYVEGDNLVIKLNNDTLSVIPLSKSKDIYKILKKYFEESGLAA